MGRRKPRQQKHKKRPWSTETVNSGPRPLRPYTPPPEPTPGTVKIVLRACDDGRPSPIPNARLGASASLRSIERGEPTPQLRPREFIRSPRAQLHETYVRLFKENIEYRRIVVLDRGPISCLYLLFRGTRWMWMLEDRTKHVRKHSIVYGSREHAYLVMQNNNICWKREEKYNGECTASVSVPAGGNSSVPFGNASE